MPYNYSHLSPDAAQLSQSAAGRIKTQTTRLALAAIEIGSDLLLVKDKLPHGDFINWLRDEFGWNDRTARRYMRVAEKFAAEDVTDLEIGLRTLEFLARDSVSDDDRGAALAIARENGGLTFTSAADLLGGVRRVDNNPSYSPSTPPSQVIIFDDDDLDDLPPDNPADHVTYESSLPIGRMTLTRTTERVTESAEIELREAVQQPLPDRLQKIVYIDPVIAYHEPPLLRRSLEQLAELYWLATGNAFQFMPKGK